MSSDAKTHRDEHALVFPKCCSTTKEGGKKHEASSNDNHPAGSMEEFTVEYVAYVDLLDQHPDTHTNHSTS